MPPTNSTRLAAKNSVANRVSDQGLRRFDLALAGWQQRFRFATARLRILPDFLIIGAQKSGTTSLYRYLVQHPLIAPSLKKEVHYFDSNYHRGPVWYRAHFPTELTRRYVKAVHGQNLLSGEASPFYLFYPYAPRRVLELIPQVRLIVLLRNPIDRAYSHYQMQVKRGFENLPFEAALEAEAGRIQGEQTRMTAEKAYASVNYKRFSYLARGIYVDQLKAWMDVFPKRQFLVLNSDDLYADPTGSYRQVLAFLRLPDWELKEFKVYYSQRYRKLAPALRQKLATYFEPHNRALYDLLGTDYGWKA